MYAPSRAKCCLSLPPWDVLLDSIKTVNSTCSGKNWARLQFEFIAKLLLVRNPESTLLVKTLAQEISRNWTVYIKRYLRYCLDDHESTIVDCHSTTNNLALSGCKISCERCDIASHDGSKPLNSKLVNIGATTGIGSHCESYCSEAIERGFKATCSLECSFMQIWLISVSAQKVIYDYNVTSHNLFPSTL